tara:strand:- start:282 stop:383 length:102 start_codon:yes stop_codon:yes gene_type:complete
MEFLLLAKDFGIELFSGLKINHKIVSIINTGLK